MTDREQGERLREAFAGSLRLPADGDRCPPPEHLWDAAHGKLDRNKVSELLLHCGECGVCAEGWRMARLELKQAAVEAGPASSGVRRWVAVAAILVVAVLGAWLISLPDRDPAPVFRDAGSSIVASTTDDVVSRDACVLTWTSGQDGSRYDLRVTDETLDTLHVAWNLEEPSSSVPPAKLDGVAAGSTILWQLTVRLPGGDTQISETFSTVVE